MYKYELSKDSFNTSDRPYVCSLLETKLAKLSSICFFKFSAPTPNLAKTKRISLSSKRIYNRCQALTGNTFLYLAYSQALSNILFASGLKLSAILYFKKVSLSPNSLNFLFSLITGIVIL